MHFSNLQRWTCGSIFIISSLRSSFLELFMLVMRSFCPLLSSSPSRFSSVSGVCTELMYHNHRFSSRASYTGLNAPTIELCLDLHNIQPTKGRIADLPKFLYAFRLAEQFKTRLTLAMLTRAIYAFHLKANSLMRSKF